MVELLDCTTRDGGHCTNWNYSDEYIFNLMASLQRNNIRYFELGYRNYYDREGKGPFYYCTPDFIKKFFDNKGELSIGVMVDTKRYKESDFEDGNKDFIDFVRIATHPKKIQETLSIAEALHSRHYNVMIQLMDVSNLLQEHYDLLGEWEYKGIIKVLYLADTYGVINADLLEKIFNKIKDLGYEKIGFHAHNQTNQALANSLKAIECGAYSIDVTQDGMGINGGNLSYNEYNLCVECLE